MGKERSVVQHSMLGLSPINVTIEDGSLWLTQRQMAEGFSVSTNTITEHLTNIFDSKELDEDSNSRIIRIYVSDGKRYNVKHYNLDTVSYTAQRCNTKKAKEFLNVHIPKLKAMIAAGENSKASEYFKQVHKNNSKSSEKKLGYVYVISHENYPGWYKVGIAKNVKKRLSAYQIADPFRRFKLEYTRLTKHYQSIEKHIHTKYENRSEWVKAPLVDIISEIEKKDEIHDDVRVTGSCFCP